MARKFITYEEAARYFDEHNCKLLEQEYIKASVPMRYICECGNESKISLSAFKAGHRCKKCGIKKCHVRYTYEKVSKIFLDNDCVLLENSYKNGKTKMRYKCSCGNIGYIMFQEFLKGTRCHKCIDRKRPHASKSTIDKRKNVEYRFWRTTVFERDNYTCQICGVHGQKIIPHHLDGYHWCEEKRFDIDNGVTLCCKHHKLFHKLYGNRFNKKEQFDDFKNMLKQEARLTSFFLFLE